METTFGAFGKMPALGDFFRLGVGADFVAPWDDWLQAAMLTARDTLGARFDDCYMTAPLWRFALAPGVMGPKAMVGVLMPSVDRVGRKYPLTLAAECAEADPLRAHFRQATILAALEQLALDALGDDMTRDLLAARLAQLQQVAPTGPARLIRQPGAQALIGAAHGMLATELAAVTGNYSDYASVWSTGVDAESRIVLADSIGDAGFVTGLFDLAAPFWVEL